MSKHQMLKAEPPGKNERCSQSRTRHTHPAYAGGEDKTAAGRKSRSSSISKGWDGDSGGDKREGGVVLKLTHTKKASLREAEMGWGGGGGGGRGRGYSSFARVTTVDSS